MPNLKKTKKQNGSHSRLFQDYLDTLELEILLHQICTKDIWLRNDRHVTCVMSNGVILLKGSYISLIIAPRGLESEKPHRKSWPGNLFKVWNLTYDGIIMLKRPYIFLVIGLRASECKNCL